MNDKAEDKQSSDQLQQSDETAERNKPDDARAKNSPKAGNILGGVQPKDK